MDPSEIRLLRSDDPSCGEFLRRLRYRGAKAPLEIEERVRGIMEQVRLRGQEALLEMAAKWDGLPEGCRSTEIPSKMLDDAVERITDDRLRALEAASSRIRSFHERQSLRSWLSVDELGCLLGQLVKPIERVGIYVPGGRASYPSSVLMNAIPARVAGVKEVVMCCPLDWKDPDPHVLAAARLAEVDRVFCVGGAHAIAAMAYGAAEIPAVDKIVGPGNIYVATAKRLVFGDVGIDMVAGPSEVCIVADGSVHPLWAALDMLSQAEHDELACAILFTPSAQHANGVREALAQELSKMQRRDIARTSIANNGAVVLTSSLDEAVKLASDLAPEHLELLIDRPWEWIGKVKNAGAIFLGPWSPEAMGDYLAGPNHVLPTGGTARFSSPLSVMDFLKRSSVVQVSPRGFRELVPHVLELSQMEGLTGHGSSAQCRLWTPTP